MKNNPLLANKCKEYFTRLSSLFLGSFEADIDPEQFTQDNYYDVQLADNGSDVVREMNFYCDCGNCTSDVSITSDNESDFDIHSCPHHMGAHPNESGKRISTATYGWPTNYGI